MKTVEQLNDAIPQSCRPRLPPVYSICYCQSLQYTHLSLPSGDSSCTYVPVRYLWTSADFPLDRLPTIPCEPKNREKHLCFRLCVKNIFAVWVTWTLNPWTQYLELRMMHSKPLATLITFKSSLSIFIVKSLMRRAELIEILLLVNTNLPYRL